jgi:hypothetical protein
MTATLSPVTITSRWIFPPEAPCAKYPGGVPGCLEITSPSGRQTLTVPYMVEPVLVAGHTVAWELTRLDNGQTYTIDHRTWGWSQATCTCGDHLYRQRVCKHARALATQLKEIDHVR